MIGKIGLDSGKLNSNPYQGGEKKEPSFRGVGALVLSGIQACERMPMINVAVIDLISAILPRTFVESLTNWFAGFEALRRESSGLIVNCLIPGAITLGIAKCINSFFMPKNTNMARCWADSSLIDKLSEYYGQASCADKVESTLKSVIGDIEGYDGKDKILFKNVLTEEELNSYSKRLAEISRKDIKDKNTKDEVKKVADEIVSKIKVANNIKVSGKNEVKAGGVDTLLKDSVKFFKEYQKAGSVSVEEFAKQSKRLVRTKSLAGLAVILPLAISMQYINRWITGKISGAKGAPIYDDFAKNKENIEEKPEAKKGLLGQKFISISMMIGVSLLSMMKKPTMGMLEFKGIFPSMDQARIISTATFASRMAAADDKNELAEATVRDIATFSSLYFLGDYAAKGAATLIQNKTGIVLLNDTKLLDKDAGVFKKIWHWIKDVNIKSSEEVVSKTEQLLKKAGKKPSEEQLKLIKKEIKHATNLRSACQVTSTGVSLILLGLIIPIFTRRSTKKKHEKALRLAEEKQQTAEKNSENLIKITPEEHSKFDADFKTNEIEKQIA